VFITWQKHYSVGNEELDGHHKVLFSIVNELFGVIQRDANASMVGEILDRLIDYTKWHFAREEELMEIHEFSGLAAHQNAHRLLVKKLEGLRFQNLQPGTVTASDLLRLMKQWWLDHVCKLDKQYSSCFCEAATEDPAMPVV